ncbi:ribonuclease H-like domain-containing protein [Rhizophagus irregularis DAOM 181602=DAOM 197198]|nr:ribonuclease H-like domain-containing protein [Rhizophagus irregularis DAOM 181602=DAOM 197198]
MSNPDRGRPFSDVWEYMIKGQQQSRGHYTATCTYCNCTWKYGKPCVLRQHLANHCKNCPQDVALYFARIVGKKMKEDEDDENDSNSDSEVPKKKQKYTFIMCNIPFSTIENLWFVDLMKTLQPGYDLPSKQTLSGTYLKAVLSHVNIRIVNELNNESNLTIGSRKEYL